MALRIGGGRPMPVEEELPMDEMEEMPVEDEMMMEEEPMMEELPEEELPVGGSVDPITAGYLGPENGPFRCGSCAHYKGEGVCEIVAGPIDEEGVCNLFTSGSAGEMEEELPMEELPEEEPEFEEEEYVEE